MKEHKRTEEQQKDYIFDIFSKCNNETASSRLQVYYPTLCEQIFIWYRDYLSINVNKIGLEISKVINCFTKDENITKIPKDKDGFFKYLKTSIYREKVGFYREYNDKDIIKIPKEIKQRKRKVEDIIKMKESQLGRELTYNERIQGISKWLYISEIEAKEYLDLINNKKFYSLDVENSDNEENNILDSNELIPPYLSHTYEEPESEFFTNFNVSNVIEAVKFVLEKKNEKVRDCYKALLTLHCIKKNAMGLYTILDHEIIDSYHKDGIKPNQYEVYQKYHPRVDKDSAGPMAAANLREFLKDIDTYLKEKNR